MSERNEPKRFEPMSFLLYLGFFAISLAMLFALYKFNRSVKSGITQPPEISISDWVNLTILIFGAICLNISKFLFDHQKLARFKFMLAFSFLAFLTFFTGLASYIPTIKAPMTASPVELGYYHFSYISGIFLLFMLPGIVSHTIIIAKVFNLKSYVESFVFSVNPPNILNLNLLVKYMSFVSILWLLIILYIKSYAL